LSNIIEINITHRVNITKQYIRSGGGPRVSGVSGDSGSDEFEITEARLKLGMLPPIHNNTPHTCIAL